MPNLGCECDIYHIMLDNIGLTLLLNARLSGAVERAYASQFVAFQANRGDHFGGTICQ